MIKADARLSVHTIPLSEIHVHECEKRYVDKLLLYIQLMEDHPEQYAGLVFLSPCSIHSGFFVLDGHHKFCASIMVGRPDALCVVIEED